MLEKLEKANKIHWFFLSNKQAIYCVKWIAYSQFSLPNILLIKSINSVRYIMRSYLFIIILIIWIIKDLIWGIQPSWILFFDMLTANAVQILLTNPFGYFMFSCVADPLFSINVLKLFLLSDFKNFIYWHGKRWHDLYIQYTAKRRCINIFI